MTAGNGKAPLADDLLHLELEAIVRRIRELQAYVVKLQANRTCERCGKAIPVNAEDATKPGRRR